MDANFSTMTRPKTMPVQNLLRYISFKTKTFQNLNKNCPLIQKLESYFRKYLTTLCLILACDCCCRFEQQMRSVFLFLYARKKKCDTLLCRLPRHFNYTRFDYAKVGKIKEKMSHIATKPFCDKVI